MFLSCAFAQIIRVLPFAHSLERVKRLIFPVISAMK